MNSPRPAKPAPPNGTRGDRGALQPAQRFPRRAKGGKPRRHVPCWWRRRLLARQDRPLPARDSLVRAVLRPAEGEGNHREAGDRADGVTREGDAEGVEVRAAAALVQPERDGSVDVAAQLGLVLVHQAPHRRVHRPAVSLARPTEVAGTVDGAACPLGDDLEHVSEGQRRRPKRVGTCDPRPRLGGARRPDRDVRIAAVACPSHCPFKCTAAGCPAPM